MQDESLENNNFGEQPPKQPLEKNQKIALAALSVIAIFFVVMWVIQFNRSIADPFAYKGEPEKTNNTPEEDANSEAVLKTKDTDQDGLNDFDELAVYKTSPYLEDSDSDGLADGEEVKKGTDPNCPAGRNCATLGILENASSTPVLQTDKTDSADDLNNILNRLNGQTTNNEAQVPADVQNLLGGQADAASLRQALLDAGMDKRILDAMTDKQLLDSYQETLKNSKQ